MHLRFRKTAKAIARRLIARYTYVILLDANFRYRRIKSFYLRRDILRDRNIRSLSLRIIFERYFTQETFLLADISLIITKVFTKLKKILILKWKNL